MLDSGSCRSGRPVSGRQPGGAPRRCRSLDECLRVRVTTRPLPPLTLPLAVAIEDSWRNAFDDEVRPVGAQSGRIRRDFRMEVRRGKNMITSPSAIRLYRLPIFTSFSLLPSQLPIGRMHR